jgi:hypothetical protein
MRMIRQVATGRFFCDCGTETHAVMEGYRRGVRAKQAIVNCWRCGHIVGLAPAARLWTASTPQAARGKRHEALNANADQKIVLDAGRKSA